MPVASPILDHLVTLADATRDRLLLLLEAHELTVGELCTVLQLPQSTVSRHLKALSDAGWVTSRAEGTSRLYTMVPPGDEPARRRLWLIVREQIGVTRAAAQDDQRLQRVLAERRSKSQEFFSSTAGQWDRLRDELFGVHFHLQALPALLDPSWIVGDLGAGTGAVAAALAPWVTRVVAVDSSAAMLQAARRRLAGVDAIEFRRGELEALPVADAELDAATMILVLPYLPQPERALAEAARALKPGGRLLVVDLSPHDREAYRQQMGHVWLGFGEAQMRSMLQGAGFEDARVRPLPPDPRAKGPALFVASARKGPGNTRDHAKPTS